MKPLEPGLWREVDELLQEALELESHQRRAFVEKSTDNATVRQALLELLATDELAEGFLAEPAIASLDLYSALDLPLNAEAAPDHSPSPLSAGATFAGYEVIRELGQGGMGVVYLCSRQGDSSDGQLVAIKVARMKLNAEAARRFAREQRILHRLRHPNVSRFLSSGKTSTGQPFFVMEYVEGTRIDRYCREHNPSLAERLRVFVALCSAVATAHELGVIHRDIKPSNVLVTGEGTPKLLDFGIAKLLVDNHVSQTDSFTQSAARPMTPAYASPEQLRGTRITAATDVYGLGLLLYTVVTDQHPFRNVPACRTGKSFAADAPCPPSRWLLDGLARGSEPETSLDAGSMDRATLRALDAIVLRAIQVEPQLRYPSADALSKDVQRLLARRSVEALRSERGRKAWSLLRATVRAVAFVAAGSLTLLSLGAALLAREGRYSPPWRHLDSVLADRPADLQARFDLVRTLVDHGRLGAAQQLVEGILATTVAQDHREPNLVATALRYEAAQQWSTAITIWGELVASFPEQTEYALRRAELLSNLGQIPASRSELDTLRNRELDQRSAARRDLLDARIQNASGDIEGALVTTRRIVDTHRNPSSLVRRQALLVQASALCSSGRYDAGHAAALSSLSAAVPATLAALRPWALLVEGGCWVQQNDPARATALLEASAGAAEDSGDLLGNMRATQYLAHLSFSRSGFDRSRQLNEKALELAQSMGHTAASAAFWQNLAAIEVVQGNLREATEAYRQARTMAREAGAQWLDGLISVNLADLYSQTGEVAEARVELDSVLLAAESGGHRRLLMSALTNLAEIDLIEDRADQAEERLRRVLKMAPEIEPSYVSKALKGLSMCAWRRGDTAAALELSTEAIASARSAQNQSDEALAALTIERIENAMGTPRERSSRYRALIRSQTEPRLAIMARFAESERRLALGDPAGALTFLGQLGVGLARLRAVDLEIEAMLLEARALVALGKSSEGRTLASRAGERAKTLGYRALARQADGLEAQGEDTPSRLVEQGAREVTRWRELPTAPPQKP